MPQNTRIRVFLSIKFCEFSMRIADKTETWRATSTRPNATVILGNQTTNLSVARLRRRAQPATGLVLKTAIRRRMIAATHNHPEW